jgi:hypothetical protein
VAIFEDTLSMISDTENPDAPGNIYDRTIQVCRRARREPLIRFQRLLPENILGLQT